MPGTSNGNSASARREANPVAATNRRGNTVSSSDWCTTGRREKLSQ